MKLYVTYSLPFFVQDKQTKEKPLSITNFNFFSETINEVQITNPETKNRPHKINHTPADFLEIYFEVKTGPCLLSTTDQQQHYVFSESGT